MKNNHKKESKRLRDWEREIIKKTGMRLRDWEREIRDQKNENGDTIWEKKSKNYSMRNSCEKESQKKKAKAWEIERLREK